MYQYEKLGNIKQEMEGLKLILELCKTRHKQ